MLTLFHHGSSACAAKVRFALAEKGLDWESRYIDLMKGEQFSPEYVALNPKAVVPTLVHDGHVIPESTVICEYLDEVFGDFPLMPDEPLLRARARIWTKAVDEELHPACSALTYIVSHRHTILNAGAGSFEEFLAAGGTEGRAARERKWQWLQHGFEAPGAAEQIRVYMGFLEKMNRELEGRDWLAGHALTLADIAMAPYLYRLSSLALEPLWLGHLERVTDWFDRVRARPAFATAFVQWMPEDLAAQMHENGSRARPQIESILTTGSEPRGSEPEGSDPRGSDPALR